MGQRLRKGKLSEVSRSLLAPIYATAPPALDVDERAELGRLRRENAELQKDCEFLTKPRPSL